jgi:hypothetical protein
METTWADDLEKPIDGCEQELLMHVSIDGALVQDVTVEVCDPLDGPYTRVWTEPKHVCMSEGLQEAVDSLLQLSMLGLPQYGSVDVVDSDEIETV